MIKDIQAVLMAALNFVRVELKSRISLFLDRALQALRDRPYTSFSASQQSRFAERWLVSNQPELETALHQRMADTLTRQTVKKEVPYEELTLLDDESLHVVMLRARLVSSLMEKARESIVSLEVRLDALKEAGAQINTKAFTPGVIADGLLETLKKLDVPPEVEIMLMEAYSERGAEMLADFYRDLNTLLINHGVLPDFKYAAAKAESAKAKPEAGAATGAAGPGGGDGGTATPGGGRGDGSSDAAPASAEGKSPPAGAANSAGSKSSATKAGMDMAPPWPAVSAGSAIPAHFAQLLDAKLSVMQQALEHLTAENWQPGTLRDAFTLPPPISLSPEQEESIDHIEAVFLDLIRDTRISDRFRSELNRLILPMMSLRLSDAELFKDPENPVRRFIRQLALLGFRDKELPIREFEHISLIVGRIVSERAQELDSFKSGADALYTIARNEVRQQLEMRHKTRRPQAETEDQNKITEQSVTDSHRFVRDALQTMSEGFHLPTIVQHFILRLVAPWMMREYQRHGEDSDEMRECILFASTFFNMLEPAANDEEHKRKIQFRKQVIEQIAFEALRSRNQEKEVVILLEGIAEYFDELNADPKNGLERNEDTGQTSFVSYLDDLPTTRLNKQDSH